jgi:hypothetical protein
MALPNVPQQTGCVNSGDVSIAHVNKFVATS